MRQHPECDYPLKLMTPTTALSESSLNAQFKRLTGMPPYTFLLGCRLQAAQQRLRDTNTSVTEIAESLGFFSAQHFATQFKQAFGITPSAWRKGHPTITR